jgi:hypothetical protein
MYDCILYNNARRFLATREVVDYHRRTNELGKSGPEFLFLSFFNMKRRNQLVEVP